MKASVLATLGTTYQGLGLYAPARERLQAALDASVAAHGRSTSRWRGRSTGSPWPPRRRATTRRPSASTGRRSRCCSGSGEADGADGAQVKGGLARVLQWLGQGDEAEALFRETLAIERRLEGDRGPGVAATLNNLGVLLGQRGDWKAAEPLHREALEIIRAVRGPEHPEVAAGMSSLGAALEENGDLAGAEALYRDSLALRLEAPRPRAPGRHALALRPREPPPGEGRRRRGRVRGVPPGPRAAGPSAPRQPTRWWRPRCRSWASPSWTSAARARRSPSCGRASSCARKALPPGHWMIASSESVLGACLTAERRYPEAEALLLRAHAGLESSRGPDHDRTVEARKRLTDLYEAWGRPRASEAWRARVGPLTSQ